MSSIASRLPILPALLLVTAGVIAYWLYQNLEYIDRQVMVPPSADVRENPLYAATQLLDGYQFDTEIANGAELFRFLPRSDQHLLWLYAIDTVEEQRDLDALMDWVANGGHLLFGIEERPSNQSSPVFKALSQAGIMPLLDDKVYDSAQTSFDQSIDLEVPLPRADSAQISPVTVSLGIHPYLQGDASSRVRIGPNQAASVLVQQPYGRGLLTAYTDTASFDNWEINYKQQAYLLTWLLQPSANRDVIVMLRADDIDGLFSLLRDRFPLVLMTLALAIVTALLYASARLGPLSTSEPIPRSNLLAHLRARGEFWHRHKHYDRLLGPVQQAAIDTLQRRFRHDAQHTEVLCRRAASLAGCSSEDAHKALYGTPGTTRDMRRCSLILHAIINSKNDTGHPHGSP